MGNLGCNDLSSEDDLAQYGAEIALAAVSSLFIHDMPV
jgi:hypothetical protein